MEIAPDVPAARGGGGREAIAASLDPVLEPSSSSSSTPVSPEKDAEKSPLNKYDVDEDEGDVCRICRNPGDNDNPLRYPCACSGSIKFVHQDCLLQWLNHSNARQCEVRFFFLSPLSFGGRSLRLDVALLCQLASLFCPYHDFVFWFESILVVRVVFTRNIINCFDCCRLGFPFF